MESGVKICNKCEDKTPQPLTNFYKLSPRKDGSERYKAMCKKCCIAYVQGKVDKEHVSIYCKARRLANPELYKEKDKRYRTNNAEKLTANRKKYRRNHIDTLADCYVTEHVAKKLKISTEQVKAIPGLVDVYRNKIALQRKIKEHGNKK